MSTTAADRLEILELLSRHQLAIDDRDGDAYAELFTSDGRFESPFATAQGRDAIKAMTLGLHDAGFTEGKRHLTGPAKIDVDGDDARAVSYWWVAETKRTPAVHATGTYTDRLRKVEGRWRIAHREQRIDPSSLESEEGSQSR